MNTVDPPAVPPRRPRWPWLVAITAAIAAALGVTVAVRETPYERCARIVRTNTLDVQSALAGLAPGSQELAGRNARITCDYLRHRGRLGEIDDRNATRLMVEAVMES